MSCSLHLCDYSNLAFASRSIGILTALGPLFLFSDSRELLLKLLPVLK